LKALLDELSGWKQPWKSRSPLEQQANHHHQNVSNARPENLPRANTFSDMHMTHFTPVQVTIRCWSGINLPCLVQLCTLSLALVFCCLPIRAAELAPPQVMLANVLRGDITLADYWVSEKFDGMRGYWDGRKAIDTERRAGRSSSMVHRRLAQNSSRRGIMGWPRPVSRAVSTVRKKIPDETQWRALHFMIFDLPSASR